MQEFGKHDGLVELYGTVEDADFTYLVMEHCKGGDLFKLLMMKGGTLDESWACLQVLMWPGKSLPSMSSSRGS